MPTIKQNLSILPMQQLFRDFFNDNLSRIFDYSWTELTGSVDVWEDNDNVFVKAVLPRFKKEDVQISIEGTALTIHAESNQKTEDKGKKYYLKEIKDQSVIRSIVLPTGIDSSQAEAVFKDGALTIKLPKKAESKPKKINISGVKSIENKKDK